MTMLSEGISVTFAVGFDELHFTGETALADPGNPTRAKAALRETIEGAIRMEAPAQPTLDIVDELLPWVQNLCFRGIDTLASGQTLTVDYFTRSGRLVLTPDGDMIQVVDSFHERPARYPRIGFLRQVLACGDRFLVFAEAVKGDDADYRSNLDYVRMFQAPAHKALANAT